MTIRAYRPEDFETVQAWAEARGEKVIPELLGKVGFIAEDDAGPCAVAFCYLYFDVPVAAVDNLFTRPNQSLKTSLRAWRAIWRVILAYLANLKDCNGQPLRYKIVRTYCREQLARFLKADNWHIAGRPSIQITYALP
jgi:hypothetical protein